MKIKIRLTACTICEGAHRSPRFGDRTSLIRAAELPCSNSNDTAVVRHLHSE